jgi:hypothetical protein
MDEKEKEAEKPRFIWVKHQETTPELYGNYVHISWTLFDVRFLLGRLIPSGADLSQGFVVEQQGAVTVAWPQVKILRDMLTDVVARYEDSNGEIKPIKLPPNTPTS